MTPFVLNTRLTPTDDAYHNLVEDVLHNGNFKGDRTGTGTYAVVGRMARYSLLNKRSPRLTTKQLTDNPEREMLWFRTGDSSIKELRDQNIGLWNNWLIPGTEKYRMKSTEELLEAIRKKYDGDFIEAQYTVAEVFAKVPEMKGINTLGECLVKITLKESDMKRHVTLYGSEENFATLEDMVVSAAVELKINPQVLTDGNIGPGAYGPQWRHWPDTQIVSGKLELQQYLEQGYTKVTTIQEAYASYEWAGKHVVHREVDQLANAIKLLENDPNSRRIIITAWNPALTWKAALPPCHLYFQFISHELTLQQRIMIAQDQVELAKYDLTKQQARTGMMDCALRTWTDWTVYQKQTLVSDEEMHRRLDEAGIKRRGLYCFLLLRSNDLGLGQPFNVAQYATLTHMVAQVAGMEALELVWAAVDAHVYTNHVEAINHQLTLESKDCIPRLKMNPAVTDIDGFTIKDIEIIDYESHPALTKSMPVAV